MRLDFSLLITLIMLPLSQVVRADEVRLVLNVLAINVIGIEISKNLKELCFAKLFLIIIKRLQDLSMQINVAQPRIKKLLI